MSRKVAREELFKLIFETEILNENTNEIFDNYLKRDNHLSNEKDLQFIREYLSGIFKNSDKIMETIDNNLSDWSFERIGTVEKALLKSAVFELLFEETPYEVVINEVVELAKLYGEEKTPEFINGVLAKIVNK